MFIMRHKFVILLVTIVAAVIYFQFSGDKPLSVKLVTVERGDITAMVANTRAGTVKACRRARLAPVMGGQIARIVATEGDQVTKDQVLMELWHDDLDARLLLLQSEVSAAKVRADEVCIRADESGREAARQINLRKDQLSSEGTVDKATTQAKASQASCQAAQTSIEVARAQVKVMEATLDRSFIRAPFDGTVAEINGEVGEFVTASPVGIPTPPAVDLIDNSCLFIEAPIDEVDAPAIKPGMDAWISLDAFSDKKFPGIVQRVAPYVRTIEKQARTVDVETVFTNPDDFKQMLPGYSADVEVVLEQHQQVVLIPTESVMPGKKVLVYQSSDGILQERVITTGIENWQLTEVLSGLEVGEQVALVQGREEVVAGIAVVPELSVDTSPAP